MKKLLIAAALSVAMIGSAIAQQGAFPNYPIIGGSSYCASTTNGVCTSTIPAGPSILTGNEQFPANTELTQGRSPQNVLVTPAALNANPIQFVTVISNTAVSGISPTNINGGVFYYYAPPGSITSVSITLPTSPIDGQQYAVSSNRSITTLAITAASGQQMGANVAPTALTASLTAPQGYNFIYNAATTAWFRLQ